jgi:type III restriction enzyme
MRGIVGAPERLTLDHLREVRDNEIILKLTGHLVFQKLRDGEDRPIASLIPKIKPIVRRFLDEFVDCRGCTVKAQLMHLQLADDVANIILGAINMHHAGTEKQPIRAVLAPYAPTGSTLDVGFNTATEDRHWANPLRSHVNWIVWDGTWERNLAERLDTHPRVIAYAKNHALGFEAPYRSGNEPRKYRPDFIVRVDDGQGGEVNLVLEVKGFRDHDAMLKATAITTQWIPGVNRLGRFGRWSFAEMRKIHDFGPALDRAIADAIADAIAGAAP